MSEPLQVGDLVMVVRATRCGCTPAIRKVFTIGALSREWAGRCVTCGAISYPTGTLTAYWKEEDGWLEVDRLKRIPPLPELESEKRDEEIAA